MLFVYWLENNPLYAERVAAIYSRMRERSDSLITSSVTIGEVLTGVYRKGPASRAEEVRTALLSLVAEVVPFAVEAADCYARIRGSTNISSANAIHLACAASAGTDLFLTNDQKLVGRIVPGIQFIVGLDSSPL